MHPRLGMILRIVLGSTLAAAAILLVAPRTPWAEAVAAWDPLLRRALVLGGLALGALLLPRRRIEGPVLWRSAEATALAGGLTLMLEALVVLGVLAVAGTWPLPALHDLVLPPGDGPGLDPTTLVVWALAPALIEEWFFRGRLLPLLVRAAGPVTAITVSAGLFAAAHGGTAPLLFALPLGLALGWVRLRSPSLYPCIFAHALHNLLALAADGALVVAGWLPALALVAGTWLVVLGWAHHRVGDLRRANRRFALVGSLALTAIVILLPLHRALHDTLWIRAAGAVLGDPRHVPLVGTARLAALDRRGLLDGHRQAALEEQLLQRSPRATVLQRAWLLAALADDGPLRLTAVLPAGNDPDLPIHLVLMELVHHPDQALVLPAVDAIAAAHPGATARYLRYDPHAFAAWLPQPERAGALLALIQAVHGRDRDALYRLLFQRYPPELASAVVLRLPPRTVTQRDRYQLRKHHPQPDDLLARLARVDLARAVAWGYEGR